MSGDVSDVFLSRTRMGLSVKRGLVRPSVSEQIRIAALVSHYHGSSVKILHRMTGRKGQLGLFSAGGRSRDSAVWNLRNGALSLYILWSVTKTLTQLLALCSCLNVLTLKNWLLWVIM